MQLTQGRGPRPWPRFRVPGSGFGRGMAPRSAFDAEWLRVTRNGSAFKTIVWLLRRDAEFRVPRSALDAEWLRVPPSFRRDGASGFFPAVPADLRSVSRFFGVDADRSGLAGAWSGLG